MSNDYKKNSLYVFGVVCANGVTDSWGDTLTKKDIKQLNSSYKRHETDTNHNYLRNVGVSVIENYITHAPMIVRGKDVPAGSWVMGMLVWNETLKESIRAGTINGYSLCSRPTSPEVMLEFINRNETPNYRDFEDKDELNPMFVSLVDGAGNGYELEYTTYSAYIERSNKQEETDMSEDNFEKYIKFMEAVNGFIERSNGSANPQPQENEEIKELKAELEETKKGFDKLIEEQKAEREEFKKTIEELQQQKEAKKDDDSGDGKTGEEEGDEGDEGGEGNPANEGGADVNRSKPADFQTGGEVPPVQGQIVPNDKFFDDGFIPKSRGYGGLPL